eukprot:RCo037787
MVDFCLSDGISLWECFWWGRTWRRPSTASPELPSSSSQWNLIRPFDSMSHLCWTLAAFHYHSYSVGFFLACTDVPVGLWVTTMGWESHSRSPRPRSCAVLCSFVSFG